MSGRDERDDRHLGLDHPREDFHFAGFADPSFDNRNLVRGRIDPRQREGHADVVVEITLGGDDAARSATEEE